MKRLVFFLIVFLIIGTLLFSGCDTKTTSREDRVFSTKYSKTVCEMGDCHTETKMCPFWNRDCE